MRKRCAGRVCLVVGAAFLLAACWGQVQAQEASSKGYAIKASLSLIGVEALDVAPQAQVQFVDQVSGFDDEALVVGLDETSTLGLLHLATGDLSSETQYVAPAEPNGFAVVGTRARAADISLGAVSLGNADLLSLSARLLTSTAVVSGYCPAEDPNGYSDRSLLGIADNFIFKNGFDAGNLDATGGSDGFDDDGLPGVGVIVVGTPILDIPLNPPANTSIDLIGLGSLVINEQIVTGDGINNRGMIANALRLTLNTGLLNAELIVAHSEASMTCP